MQQPFGTTLNITLSPTRSWLTLGPGWAALAGLLSSGYPAINLAALLQIISLWILVDPILGTVWEFVVQQGLWRQISRANLPPPPAHGFLLPYAQPGSTAGRLVLRVRRYRLWWQETYWPAFGNKIVTVTAGIVLALFLGFVLHRTIFWLALLAISLTLLAGLTSPNLSTAGGGRLQSVVQFLLPWGMGMLLFPNPQSLSLVAAFCYWVVYLGGLRMLGHHQRAEWLFFLGQIAIILLLLAMRLLPGATIVAVLFTAQLLIRTTFREAEPLLSKVQPYLVTGLLMAGISLGSL